MKKTTSNSIILRVLSEHTIDYNFNNSFNSFKYIDVCALGKLTTEPTEEVWKIILPAILEKVSWMVQEYLEGVKKDSPEARILDLQVTVEPVTTIKIPAEYRAHEYSWDDHVKGAIGVDLYVDGTYDSFAQCLDKTKHVLDGINSDESSGTQLKEFNQKLIHNFDDYNQALKTPKAIDISKWSNGCGDEAYALEKLEVKTIWEPSKILKIDIESLNINLKNGRVL